MRSLERHNRKMFFKDGKVGTRRVRKGERELSGKTVYLKLVGMRMNYGL